MGADAEEGDSVERLFRLIDPGVSSEDIDKALFQLTWKQHGGSGTNLTLSEAEGLSWERFTRWLKNIEEQREREHRALEKAGKKK